MHIALIITIGLILTVIVASDAVGSLIELLGRKKRRHPKAPPVIHRSENINCGGTAIYLNKPRYKNRKDDIL